MATPEPARPIRPSSRSMLVRIILAIFLVETAYAGIILTLLLFWRYQYIHHPYVFLLWLAQTLKFGVLAVVIWRIVEPFTREEYSLQGSYLYRYSSDLAGGNKDEVFELKAVKDLEVTQGLIAKRLNYGDVRLVFSFSYGAKDLTLVAVQNPHEIAKYIKAYF